jgi:hypothetical protein
MSEQNTLRDQLSQAFDKHEETPVVETPVVETQPVETAEQAAERVRDEKGRFAPKQETTPPVEVQPQEVPVEVQEVQRPQRPTSWKKDYWDHWDKLDPKLAEYLSQREQEYAKGVSTYKNEWDRAKPLMEALAPFQPLLQQYNVNPAQWIQNLGSAHQKLVLGSPQEKLQMFAKLAQDYGVNLQALLGGEQQYIPPTFPTQFDIKKTVQDEFEQMQAQQALIQFEQEAPTKYPHYEQVKSRMAGLLQAGLANDLPDAYEQAVRSDATLFESLQEQRLKEEIAKRTQAANNAKANAVSPRSATPADTNGNAAKTKDRRSVIASAFDEAQSNI